MMEFRFEIQEYLRYRMKKKKKCIDYRTKIDRIAIDLVELNWKDLDRC